MILLLIAVFSLGYLAIILEHVVKVNKSAIAMFMAIACWAVFFLLSPEAGTVNLSALNHQVAAIAQIVF
ncbi:MAG TPA: sodium:proton antiporter, partial [Rhabdochlamydiaceae bacterium]|nr:sodium:proton antiporter [Rhabdochlamydiaceae bacterium]